MQSIYGAPLCQSLNAAPLDALITGWSWRRCSRRLSRPASPSRPTSEAERAALERHWQQRLERARYEVERARRQYDAVEPENRLVAPNARTRLGGGLGRAGAPEGRARTLWRERPETPSPEELARSGLTQDLPALWRAETTTQEERQTIVRLLVERILVEIIASSKQVRVQCHWHGGYRTAHRLTRPVARLRALSTYDALVERAAALHRMGHGFAEIAWVITAPRPRHRRICQGRSRMAFSRHELVG